MLIQGLNKNCVCIYKNASNQQKSYKKCEIKIIDDREYFWINRKGLEIESDYQNLVMIFDKCDPKKQKHRHKLILNS